MRFRFLVFLLVVLGLTGVLVADGPRLDWPRDAAALAAIAGLAALSVWRYRHLAASVVCDIGGAGLILVIGWAMGDHLTQVFGLAFVHLFVRALDVSLPRVALNAVLHPAAYFAAVALAHGGGALARMDTATNLVGFVFVAGLMHALALSFAEQEQMSEQISFQAFHDPMTRLPNRLLFTDRLEQALARSRRDGGLVALVFIDLDDFKDVNDSFGHACGDQLLVSFAERLTSRLRTSDTAARLGGDEFALILEDVADLHEALAAVERVRAPMRDPFEVAGRQITVTPSVGIAISSTGTSSDELLHSADVAMYAAKAAGKDRCELYDSVMEAASHRQFSIAPAAPDSTPAA